MKEDQFNMKEDQIETTKSGNLRDFFLRRKLSLSKNEWNQFNDKWQWHDVSKKEEYKFVKSVDNWKSNTFIQKFSKIDDKNVLESLESKLVILSILNIGLVFTHLSFIVYRL
jgi:hypothetical protein